MTIRIEIQRETFSASEAETMTGVPQVVMRDWRRRDLLKTKTVSGRAVFEVLDLAYLIILKQLTAWGVAVGTAAEAALFARFMVMDFAEWASIQGEDARFVGSRGTGDARFLILPTAGGVIRCAHLEGWQAMQDSKGQSASGIVLDCKALGEDLAGRSPRPVVTVKRSDAE